MRSNFDLLVVIINDNEPEELLALGWMRSPDAPAHWTTFQHKLSTLKSDGRSSLIRARNITKELKKLLALRWMRSPDAPAHWAPAFPSSLQF